MFYSENKINFLYGRSLQLFNVPLISSFSSSRNFHLTSVYFGDGPNKPSSKIEETVQALKEKAKEKESPQVSSAPIDEKKPEVAKKVSTFQTIRKKVIDELVHYYHGFRLLFIDINVSRKLVWRVLNGHTLRRREKKLVSRARIKFYLIV